jgi:hypothetical protein
MNTVHSSEQIANRTDNRISYSHRHENNPFFRRPHLRIGEHIEKVPIELKVGRRNQNEELIDEKTFKANIWILNISNIALSIFSTTAKECSATLYTRNLGSDVPLRWRIYSPEPKKCLVNEVPGEGESLTAPYHRLMPYYYAVVELAQRHAVPNTTIDVGEVYGLYFLFTYEDSNHAFIITPLEIPKWYGENELFYPVSNHGMFLFLDEGEEREISVTFESNRTPNNVYITRRKLRIKFSSWDNVDIL